MDIAGALRLPAVSPREVVVGKLVYMALPFDEEFAPFQTRLGSGASPLPFCDESPPASAKTGKEVVFPPGFLIWEFAVFV